MKVEDKKVIGISYELSVGTEEKEILEIVQDDEPMMFIYGLSGLPEAFERNISGLSAGDTFEFSISSEDSYGSYDNEAVVNFPISEFQIEDGKIPEGMLEIGNFIPFRDDENHTMQGRVVDVDEEIVVLDFNHPLAGEELHFKGKIVSIREASPSELDHGHVHGAGGVSH